MLVWDFWDRVIASGVLLVAAKRKWPFRVALNYVTLCAAMTTPALLTVPNLFAAPIPEDSQRKQKLVRAYVRGYMRAMADRGVRFLYVNGATQRIIECRDLDCAYVGGGVYRVICRKGGEFIDL